MERLLEGPVGNKPTSWSAPPIMRVDKLITGLPTPKMQDLNAAAALQELLGGRYEEMSTPVNLYVSKFQLPQQGHAMSLQRQWGLLEQRLRDHNRQCHLRPSS